MQVLQMWGGFGNGLGAVNEFGCFITIAILFMVFLEALGIFSCLFMKPFHVHVVPTEQVVRVT
jgi:hypothetical protein